MNLEIAFIGFFVGALVGLTGIGGASILMPLLIFLGIPPSTAVGTDFLYNSVTKLTGAIQHIKQKSIDFNILKLLMVGCLPAAIISNLAFYKLFYKDDYENIILIFVGLALILSSMITFLFNIKGDRPSRKSSTQKRKHSILIIGILIGVIIGVTSIGSGSLIALFLIYFFQIKPSTLVGTDLTIGFFITTVTGLLMMSYGHIDYLLLMNLLIGSIPGAYLGSKLTLKIYSLYLKTIILTIIFLSGCLLFTKFILNIS